MTPSPIRKVLSTFRRHRVRALLMGGQACVLYGAAEFSRDVDFLVDPDDSNIVRLRRALADLRAEQIFFPALDAAALRRGHGCHFRCRVPGAERLRVDLMSRIRGNRDFSAFWRRRWTIRTPGMGTVAALAPPDLVHAKKTQRDKDWPMIARLVEVHFRRNAVRPTTANRRFWFLEARSAELLVELVRRFPRDAANVAPRRAAVRIARIGNLDAIRRALFREQEAERRADQKYWAPLRTELAQWRRQAATHRPTFS